MTLERQKQGATAVRSGALLDTTNNQQINKMNANIAKIQTAIEAIESSLAELKKTEGFTSYCLWRHIGDKCGCNPKPTHEIIAALEDDLNRDRLRNAALAKLTTQDRETLGV
jgi:hypothetical protein